ncbi:winged helix-turn-helix transcriptional regulator [Crocinitomicaceae bacterium CZZ-1]|uniref:Winged helix-turn-helix transcriptional regulator n=1 Tax=Taishania pollutisoli TaxID=2766479 RepID=A0A8J6TYY5_9FLAO|nr:MarR family winged helix-turn-helix transcriptional regulator [Taishania pollutisoli]MBC9811438.1 winged helix-turn-helix transcriptional regulator [Taishania pollutisoli]MBX2947642.1 winged helix-turn-helix transcriptional regulator [Crocinitomicaceae bacterium]NGF75223.1 winged helix-turn-helix transcriptional regulator [Fluviicola sp. SGL-29]
MNSLELVKVLIEKLEQYEGGEADKDNLSLEGYIQSLGPAIQPEAYKNSLVGTYEKPEAERSFHIENNIERVISQHVLFLYRYIKFYSKIAFSESRIKTLEEFSFLITVMQHQRISKTDLIKRNVFEKSSGIEIINRLIKAKMLMQQDNPEDQRSQLILLTDTGKFELFGIFGKMNTLGKIATGELTQREKEQLTILLKKLDTFHFDNYTNKTFQTLEDYLPQQ